MFGGPTEKYHKYIVSYFIFQENQLKDSASRKHVINDVNEAAGICSKWERKNI